MRLLGELNGLRWSELLGRTWREFWKDRVLDQAAKCSYYFLFSAFPLLFFLVSLLGLALQAGPELFDLLYRYIGAVLPPTATRLVRDTLAEVMAGSDAVKLSAALLLTWWSAAQGMRATMEALNIAYEVRESRPWWKQILVASLLTMVALVMITLAMMLLIYGGRAAELAARLLGYDAAIATAWQALQWLLVLVFVVAAFNMIYVFGPNLPVRRWRKLAPGTLVGVALWLAVSFAFKLYLNYFDRYSVTYGSIGAVIVLLLWFYLSGTAILIGGEINSEVDKAGLEREHARERGAPLTEKV